MEEVIISQGSEGTACPLRNGGRGYNKPWVRGDSMSPERMYSTFITSIKYSIKVYEIAMKRE